MTSSDIEIGLSDEDRSIRETAHRFAEEVLRPIGCQLDREPDPERVIARDSPLWEALRRYHELGLGRLTVDTEMDPLDRARLTAIVNEELAWGDVGLAITLGLSQFHVPWVQQCGDRELLERFVECDRPVLACWAVTEPDHGSDTIALTEAHFRDPRLRPNCVARREGGDYVIEGQKAAWVSNGTIAEIAVLFCTLDPSQGFHAGGVLLVPLDLPGVSRSKPLDKLGQRSLNQGALFFDRVRVPARYCVLGPELYALALEAMLAQANAAMGQLFVGVARAAYEHALAYAKQRVQGGVAIFQHQSVRARLFGMFTRVEAARSLARRVALHLAGGSASLPHCIAAKVFCTQAAFEVASDAVQVFGGNGLAREYPVEKLLRDTRASLIEDGCNEVLSLIGAARL